MTIFGHTLHVGVASHLGGLAIFPVWTDAPSPDGLVTRRQRPDAISVEELPTPAVPSLQVRNLGRSPLLLLEGESLTGGLQDRVTNATVLVPAAASIVVPVSCIERGRWSRSGAARRAGHTSPSLRAKKNRAVAASRTVGRWDADQMGVWGEVERLRASHGAAAPSSSYNDVRDHALDRVRSAWRVPRPLEGQRGVMFGIGGHVRALDLFGTSDALAAYWDDLVEAALVEATLEPEVRTPGASARAFAIAIARTELTGAPSVGLGRDLRGSRGRLDVSGLDLHGRIAHLAAFAEVSA